ncbi:adenylosuccinate lyase [Metallosphaera tengchongensis]|uniref:Adenylosuccinate lyase n=1 Tax=Metallosphaera tengchongensis TaxID=1532350 RepID=A0A6N0NXL5_9CREN|nr:adenylosuccinate lyase [Metallosphaera tengchongensis]QKQ99849.1 adenylosuccinate lyase [Metallosphaera tengchongensis]
MDIVCPIDWRYGSGEMKRIFTRESSLQYRIRVELAILNALSDLGYVSKEDVQKVKEASKSLRIEEIDELESKLGHDVMAMVVALAEKSGDSGRFIHFGATSYDIVDTANALIVKDALSVIKKKIRRILEKLKEYSITYEDEVMVGRTHGQHAVPITLGFKMANYLYEMSRALERLLETEKRVVLGKMSGAVGTMAAWGSNGIEVEKRVMEELGLEPHAISTQIAPRDGFAELISNMTIAASVMDRFAIEVRELMRPEIGELAEGVGNRVGSSTMPHKENPVTAEKVSGLAKLMRGMVIPALENIPLWHERDLTNSSSERFIIPHVFLIMDEMLDSFYDLLTNLRVYPGSLKRNLQLTKGLNMAESLMINLTLKGMSRHKAHEIVSRLSREAKTENKTLYEVAKDNDTIKNLFNDDELKEVLNPQKYLGEYKELIRRAIAYYETVVKEVER